jgi:hypothetical protein
MPSVDLLKLRLVWVVYFSLGLCLAYSIFHLANYFGLSFFILSNRSMIEQTLSGSVFTGFWGIVVFVVLARLGYDLELNLVRGYYRSFAFVGLLVAVCGMAVGVCLVVLGFVGTVALVPISCLLLSLCVVFSPDFFGVNRLHFFLRVLFGGLIVGLLIELASFFVYEEFVYAFDVMFSFGSSHYA